MDYFFFLISYARDHRIKEIKSTCYKINKFQQQSLEENKVKTQYFPNDFFAYTSCTTVTAVQELCNQSAKHPVELLSKAAREGVHF